MAVPEPISIGVEPVRALARTRRALVRARTRARALAATTVVLVVAAGLAGAFAAPAGAVNFPAAQNATLHLGGPDWVTPREGSLGDRGLEEPGAVASDGTRVYVADTQNSRVLGWNSITGSDGVPFDFIELKPAGANQAFDPRVACNPDSSKHPAAISIGGGRMAVADMHNDRVLLWNTTPTASTTAPNIVLGQANFATCSDPDSPSLNVTASNVNDPTGVWTNGTKLAVVDSARDRVLIWNTWPTSNNQPADLVLGQPNKTTKNAPGAGWTKFDTPWAVAGNAAGSRLLVTDSSNDRVLGWSTWPAADGTGADRVFGQNDELGTSSSCSQTRMSSPRGVWTDGTNTIVADTMNNRVLYFTAWPAAAPVSAASVHGQTAWNQCNGNRNQAAVGSDTLHRPYGVWSDGTQVLVADTGNARVLRFATFPTGALTNLPAASRILGQSSAANSGANALAAKDLMFTSETTNSVASENGLWPFETPGGELLVAAARSNFMYRWSAFPTATNAAPTWRFFQPTDSNSNVRGINDKTRQDTTNTPMSPWTDGTRLTVADSDQNRLLVWTTYPTTENQLPTFAWGQGGSFTTSSSGTTALTLSDPKGTDSDGTRFALVDQNNNRVLLWNSFPTGPADDPDVVLGQPDFTSGAVDNGGIGARTLDDPVDVALFPNGLAVSDYGNDRILVWRSWPTSNFAPADAVIGQANFTSSAVGAAAEDVTGIAAAGNAILFTGNCGAHVVDPIPTSGAVTAVTSTIGTPTCPSATLPAQNRSAVGSGIDARGGRVWIGMDQFARIMRWDDVTAPTYTVPAATSVTCDGQVTVTFSTAESTTTEVYWDSVSRAAYGSYASNQVDSNYTGLAHSITISVPTAGTYFARVRAVDWAGNVAATPAEFSFTVPATCPAPTTMLADDTNAQAGFGRANPSTTTAPPIGSTTFHSSWQNVAGATMDRRETQTWTTPPEHAGGLWQLDGATAADPSSQYGTGMTWTGTPTWTTGRFGQAAATSGSNFLSVPHNALISRSNGFTVDAWYRATAIGSANPAIVMKSDTAFCGVGTNCNYAIEFDQAGNQLCGVVVTTLNVEQSQCRSATGVLDGQFHHVALSVTSGNQLRFYVDGQPVSGSALALGAAPRTNTGALYVGNTSNTLQPLVGAVDAVRFSPVAYDAAAILGYYRTSRPHAQAVWGTDNAALGATCATATRCEDQVYAGSADILRTGARYWQRTRFNTLANDYWTAWATDWLEVTDTTSLSISTGPVASIGTGASGVDSFASSTVQVTSNGGGGYALTATDESDTWGVDRDLGGGTIVDVQDGSLPPAVWPAGAMSGFGVTVTDATGGRLAKWGPGSGTALTDVVNNRYTGLENSTSVVLHQRATYGTSTDSVVLGWRVDPNGSVPLGAYSGVISLSAIANP